VIFMCTSSGLPEGQSRDRVRLIALPPCALRRRRGRPRTMVGCAGFSGSWAPTSAATMQPAEAIFGQFAARVEGRSRSCRSAVAVSTGRSRWYGGRSGFGEGVAAARCGTRGVTPSKIDLETVSGVLIAQGAICW